MISIETIPLLLIIGLSLWLLAGVGVMTYGRKLPRAGDWVAGLPVAYLITVFSLALAALADDKFAIKTWVKGWIGPHDELGAVTVGILLDPLGLTISLATGLIVALFLVNRAYLTRETAPERIFAALAVSGVGVTIAWLAVTPWLVVCGLGLSLVGGLFASGAHWDSEDESKLAARFAWERVWGLILAVIGLCLLAGTRGAIVFSETESWASGAASPQGALRDAIGAGLLVAGLFVNLSPFPFLGSLLVPSALSTPIWLLTRQIFPALCAYAMMLRLEPELRAMGVFPVYGWVALASAFLTLASGFFQREWRTGLSSWLAAGLSVSSAALAFAGPRVATSILLSVVFGCLALACAATTLESSQEGAPRGGAMKTALVLAAAAGTGMVGFIGAGGGVQTALKLLERPVELGFFMFVLFFSGMLGWSISFRSLRLGEARGARWPELATPFVLVILSLGLVWSGTATGGALVGSPDQLFQPLFDLFFGAQAVGSGDQGNFPTAIGVYGGVAVVALLVAFSTSGGGRDSWANLATAFPRFAGFLGSGYRLENAAAQVLRGVTRTGEGAEWLISQKLWDRWIPMALATGIRRGAALFAQLDVRLGTFLAEAARRGVEVPARGLQLIQSGDVRWYLFFAVGSGLAILLNYLR